MDFILLIMFIYLYLKYRDMSKDLDKYVSLVDELEDKLLVYMEEKKDV